MSMKGRLAVVVLMLFASCTGAPTDTPESGAGPPNVIVIFADDLGYADVSFNNPDTPIQTPNLQRLADEGVVFTNGYVTSPVCRPSRAGLLTGRYPARFGLEANLESNPYDQQLGLPLDETLISTYMGNVGYHTGVVGKWQLGTAHHFGPLERDFDYFYGSLIGNRDYFSVDANDIVDKMHPLIENRGPATFNGYLTDALTDKSIEFATRNRSRPFFLYLPYTAPHSPYDSPRDMYHLYEDAKGDRRSYMRMVHRLDENIGRLLDALDASGKRHNTIIFFLSDNGGAPRGPMDNGALRGGKVHSTRAVFESRSWPHGPPGGPRERPTTPW